MQRFISLSKLSAWSLLVFSLLPPMLVTASGFCETRQPVIAYSRAQFFETSGGTLALMPNVRSAVEDESIIDSEDDDDVLTITYEDEFFVFPDSGLYVLDKQLAQNPWTFLINHRQRPARSSYLGVMILKVFDYPLKSDLELVRNAQWIDGQGANLARLSDRTRPKNKFMAIHDSVENADALDALSKAFEIWHATPVGSADFSWIDRVEWQGISDVIKYLENITPGDEEDNQILLQARLISFRTSQKAEGYRLVDWDIDIGDVNSIMIKTFSPVGSNFDGYYCIVFE